MSDDLFYLVYRSAARTEMGSKADRQIVEEARRNNPGERISGFIHREPNTYTHYLEGPRSKVETLYEHLKQDPRHTNVRRVSSGPLDARQCANWPVVLLNDQDRYFAIDQSGRVREGDAGQVPIYPFSKKDARDLLREDRRRQR